MTRRLHERLAEVQETRARLLECARARLNGSSGTAAFTLDAVARDAGVTRTTVYNQFQSKAGLLHAVCDDLVAAGGMQDLSGILGDPDPYESLHRYVAAFVHFYATDRVLLRRLFAMAALDPEVRDVLSDREDRRRKEGLKQILVRIYAAEDRLRRQPSARDLDRQALMLKAALHFDVFDTLQEGRKSTAAVQREMQEIVHGIVSHQLGLFRHTLQARGNRR